MHTVPYCTVHSRPVARSTQAASRATLRIRQGGPSRRLVGPPGTHGTAVRRVEGRPRKNGRRAARAIGAIDRAALAGPRLPRRAVEPSRSMPRRVNRVCGRSPEHGGVCWPDSGAAALQSRRSRSRSRSSACSHAILIEPCAVSRARERSGTVVAWWWAVVCAGCPVRPASRDPCLAGALRLSLSLYLYLYL